MYLWTAVMCVSILYMLDTSIAATQLVYGTIGSDVELVCTVEANNECITWFVPPNYTVYAVGNEVANDKYLQSFIDVAVQNKTLKISELSTEKEGLYSCLCGRSNETFEIRIKKNPSNMTVVNATDKGIIYGVERTDLSLECTVNRGEPGCNITWTNNDHVYAAGGPEYVNYRFIPGRSDHNKVFQCTAYNSDGEKVESRNIALFIFYKPVVTISAQPSQVVREGHNLELKCKHDGNDPNATIEWTWNETKRPANANILKFASVKRQEAGEYTCKVYTKGGNGVGSILTVIQYPPNVTIIERQHDNNTYALRCIANGVPNKYVYSKWEHMTEWSNHVRFVEGSPNGHITIQNDPSNEYGYYQNSGIYVCNVSNNVSDSNGSLYQTAITDLKIKEKLQSNKNSSCKDRWPHATTKEGKPRFLASNEQSQHAMYGREGVIQLFVYSFPKFENISMFSGNTALRLQSENKQWNYYLEENEALVQDTIYSNLVTVRAYRITIRINKITEEYYFTNQTIYATNKLGTASFTVRLIPEYTDTNLQMMPNPVLSFVFIFSGILIGFFVCCVIQGVKKKACFRVNQKRERTQRNGRAETDVASHYDEIDTVYFGPFEESENVVTLPSSDLRVSIEHRDAPFFQNIQNGNYDRQSCIESDPLTISNSTTDSHTSDESYLVPTRTFLSRYVQTSPERSEGSSVSSNENETNLENVQEYESLQCVHINEHPYLECHRMEEQVYQNANI